MRAKQYDNVLSPEVSSKAELRRLVDRVISFGSERSGLQMIREAATTRRWRSRPGRPEIGYNGQNGLKLYSMSSAISSHYSRTLSMDAECVRWRIECEEARMINYDFWPRSDDPSWLPEIPILAAA